jgi:endonuclease-3
VKPKKKWKPNEIIEILDEAYARPPQQVSRDPMFELILTVLSQHTSDHNSGEAMHRLLEKFPSWELILSSDVAELEEAIRPGGLAPTKSKRITYILREIADRNDSFDLSFLEFIPLTEARDWLVALPGVGPKTAACVLLFALGRPVLPVDTHVERVSKRLGLIPANMTAEKAHTELEESVSPKDIYAYHMDLIQHGRRTCHARNPACEACPLADKCPRVGL